MRSPNARLQIVIAGLCACIVVVFAVTRGTEPANAQTPSATSEPDLVAVLDLQSVGAQEVEAIAITERLREVLLKSGRFKLVDRSQMNAVLNEQALQQTGCTEQDCAVQVGRMLGVRKIVAGRAVKFGEDTWLLSVLMVDVETAETLAAESLRHRGDVFDLVDKQIPALGLRLAAVGQPSGTIAAKPSAAVQTPAPVAPPPGSGGRLNVALFPTLVTGAEHLYDKANETNYLRGVNAALEARKEQLELTYSGAKYEPFLAAFQAFTALPDGKDWAERGWTGVFSKEPDMDYLRRVGKEQGIDAVVMMTVDIQTGRGGGKLRVFSLYVVDPERERQYDERLDYGRSFSNENLRKEVQAKLSALLGEFLRGRGL